MIERASKGPRSDIEPFVRDFDQFYLENYRSVVALVYTLTGSRHGAEDIAQDAFLRAHRQWREVSGYERQDGWVRVVAMNLARSRLRRIGAETRALGRVAGLTRTTFPELEPHNERFWQAVRDLPRRQREVVALHYLEDRPVADVAEILGVAESTIKNSLAQGRRTLARTLEVAL
ncbi:MAG: sigma-70 family RNA polymerase sigma factor [Acidimicrobiia bacterium]